MSFLAPIEFVLLKIFEASYSLTNNYGVSLILMSITVTLGTYPLYYLADIWKKKEDSIQLEMKKEIDDIKRVFKGQKQFYLIQATYRFHNYKSWYALRAALGLLIQIPFFFAAYNVLSSYQGYVNHSFLCFSDLSKPDSLLFGINLLPIIMTVVNLISSFVYTRSFSIKDNKQLSILALVFFVFLYNSPSALLIYWTNNNILSLIKSYFLNRQKTIKYLSSNEKRDIKLVLIASAIYSLFLLSQFTINHIIKFKNYFLLGLFICNILLLPFSYYKQEKNIIKLLLLVLKKNIILCILLGVFIPVYMFRPYISIINIKPFDALVLFTCLFLFICKQILIILNIESKVDILRMRKDLILSFIIFSIAVCIVMPIKFYLSSSEEIGCNISRVLLVGGCVFVCTCILSYIFLKIGSVLTYLSCIFILVISTINIVFPINVGVISGFGLTLHPVFTNVSFASFCRDAFIGLIAIATSLFIYKKNITIIKYFALIILIVPVIQILFHSKQNYIETTYKQEEQITQLPEQYKEMHELSSDNINIIYICLDMFNSEYIPRLQNDIEDFDNKFRGFTFYKDCLSVSGWTHTSFGGALYYGNEYSPMENNNNKVCIQDAGEEAIKKLKSLLQKNDFKSSFINDVILWELPLVTGSKYEFADYWCYKNNETLSSVSKVRLLQMLALFQLVPTVIKRYVYDDARWIIYGESASIQWTRDYVIKSYAYLDLLPELSSNTSDKPVFLSIRTDLPHDPYGLNSNGDIINNSFPDPTEKSFYSPNAAYYSAKGTIQLLLNYFDWMKANNVWDNSIIVLFSDHGNNCYDNNIPNPQKVTKEEAGYLSRSNALYLIKPLNSNEDFSIDSNTYKSNGDILFDVFSSIGIETDIKPCTVDGIRYYSFMKNIEDYNQHKTFVDYASYKVTGSIFSEGSWEKIQ